jgi:hypothetical protein
MAQSLPSTLLSYLPSSLGALATSFGALPSLVSTLPSQMSRLVPTGTDSIQDLTTVLTKQKDFLPSQKTRLVSTLRSAFLPGAFGTKETISTQIPGPSEEAVPQVEGTKISQKEDDFEPKSLLERKTLEYDSDLYGSKVSERQYEDQDIISLKNGLELIMESESKRYGLAPELSVPKMRGFNRFGRNGQAINFGSLKYLKQCFEKILDQELRKYGEMI